MDLSKPIMMDNKKLRENNPDIKAHFEACEKELEPFPKKNGIICDQKIIEWVNCSVCNSSNTLQWMVKWGGRYDECQNCSHIFLKNRFHQEVLTRLYQTSEADQKIRKIRKHPFNHRYWTAVYDKYMGYFCDLFPKEALILDVGCGSGRFLQYCYDKGFKNIHGLDVYPALSEECKESFPAQNLHVVESFETSRLSIKFDMIFLWGVLEHLRNLNDVFIKCAEYIKESGRVFIFTPNIHSRARRILGVYTPTINPRQHINFITRKSMKYLCETHHFKTAQFEHELPIIDLMWPYVHEEEKLIEDINFNKEGYYHVYILEKH